MARSVTGLFIDQAHLDRIVGALRDAGFEADHISVVSPDGSPLEGAGDREPTSTGRAASGGGLGVWLARHLEGRGVSREHAGRYQARVAEGRHLVSVEVTTDAQDEEARNLMVDTGAEEISSAADGGPCMRCAAWERPTPFVEAGWAARGAPRRNRLSPRPITRSSWGRAWPTLRPAATRQAGALAMVDARPFGSVRQLRGRDPRKVLVGAAACARLIGKRRSVDFLWRHLSWTTRV